ncbi:MAG: crotonyl-CoA carboxylase/reductase [Rhodospirillaceae bacterium]|nr:MAG: crotonyl-CoA carboxylase/reductase [Rhodospirillaceae bacterium]
MMRERKKLYPVGEIPPLKHLPERMHAFAVRRDRHGEPLIALRPEIVPTPRPDSGEVVVMVMAAGVGMETVWAGLGIPATPFMADTRPYHVPGSDCAGVVWAVGATVTGWQAGDEVVIHPVVADSVSSMQQIWGFETPDGALAQFARVQAGQLLPRPTRLSWAESACYLFTLAKAYRMLLGHPPHRLEPGGTVLVWGASEGIGAMAVQLAHAIGATVVGVVNSPEQVEGVLRLGAVEVIDRSRFARFESLSDVEDTVACDLWQRQTEPFRIAVTAALGRISTVDRSFDRCFDIVCEQSGQSTFPLSCQLVRRGGMVVFCGGTTGYTFTFDARPAWMGEIRLQGSHLASAADADAANRLVTAGVVDPCLSAVFDWWEAPLAHARMLHGKGGTGAVLVQGRTRKR